MAFRLRDLAALLAVAGLAGAALAPAIARSREAARRRQCADNLRAIGLALRQYHDAQGMLPPAAIWRPAESSTLMLYEVKRFDKTVYENWAQLLLPHLGRDDVAAKFDRELPVMHAANAEARLTRVAEFVCPTDGFNGTHNPYGFQPWDERPPLAEFARGNYAINGGTHSIKRGPESTVQPRGERLQVVLVHDRRHFEATGTGVAGINRCFRLSEFTNGQSTLVAVDEVRAGVHSLDVRGVWALGHIGSSITWAHGVVGDAGGPNNQWDRSDDLFDCGRVHKALGTDRLAALGMPCCPYIDLSQEATARSQHPGGVHALFLDGAVRFVRDEVDRGLWHVMHSRETPADLLADLDSAVNEVQPPPDARDRSVAAREPELGDRLTNSIGMRFVGIPRGTFTMGVKDRGNSLAPPPECPPHEVTITHGFWLGECEVTQGQFQQVMGHNPSAYSPDASEAQSTDDFPVEQVTWHDAVAFCERLSGMEQEKTARRSYRLPTEAEWEYACRSGTSEPYTWTAQRAADDDSGEAAGIEPALPVTKVGSYRPNSLGLYDMRGNVWEWCGDWFDRGYYLRSPKSDPQGPATGYLKVVRGGDWIFVGEICPINYPIMSPSQSSPFLGFRVVCEVLSGE